MYYQIPIERDIKIHVKSIQPLKQMLELPAKLQQIINLRHSNLNFSCNKL